jgi:hypothetical protein
MNKSNSPGHEAGRGERGAVNLKFIAVLAVVGILVYMGFQYVPVAYHASVLKTSMDDTVLNGSNSAMSIDQRDQWVINQIKAKVKEYGFPPDTKISPKSVNGGMELSVQFTQPVNLLPGFTYQYKFDYTAKTNNSLNAPQQ